jgi:N-sulfoglucosamine sulfohydrolase
LVAAPEDEVYERPNILFAISDDQSFPHAGAYGTNWVKTPAFDRVANEGLLFYNGYTPNAKCSPSRSILLTGRNSWQLEEAANHVPFFPAKFKTFPETLQENGYFTGYTGKGWAPGDPGMKDGKRRELIGPVFSEIRTEPPAMFISILTMPQILSCFLKQNRMKSPFSSGTEVMNLTGPMNSRQELIKEENSFLMLMRYLNSGLITTLSGMICWIMLLK